MQAENPVLGTPRLRLRIPEGSDGHGFATEAAQAALLLAWDHVDTDHVISIIQPESLASVRVAEKIGERFERADTLNGASVHIYGIRRTTQPRTRARQR
jgi:RimJ/RimL family protein N-acetyltransferase